MLGVFGECLLKTYKNSKNFSILMVLCRAGNQLEVWLMSNRICDYEMNRIEYHFLIKVQKLKLITIILVKTFLLIQFQRMACTLRYSKFPRVLLPGRDVLVSILLVQTVLLCLMLRGIRVMMCRLFVGMKRPFCFCFIRR